MGLQGTGIKGFSGCSVRLLSQWIAIRSGRRWRRRGRNSGQARIQIWTTSNCICTNGLRNIRPLLEGRKIAAHEVARLRREIQKSAFIIHPEVVSSVSATYDQSRVLAHVGFPGNALHWRIYCEGVSSLTTGQTSNTRLLSPTKCHFVCSRL